MTDTLHGDVRTGTPGPEPRKRNPWLIGAVILAVGIIAAALILAIGSHHGQPAPRPSRTVVTQSASTPAQTPTTTPSTGASSGHYALDYQHTWWEPNGPNAGLVQPTTATLETDPDAQVDSLLVEQNGYGAYLVAHGSQRPTEADLVEGLTYTAQLAVSDGMGVYSHLIQGGSPLLQSSSPLLAGGHVEFSPGTSPSDDVTSDPHGGWDYRVQMGSPYGGAVIETLHLETIQNHWMVN